MSSEDEVSDASLLISTPETQFIPQEGDEEVLWKVIEITAETKKSYKVKWEGINPTTNKPWAQSWVTKHDCTDDLVAAWKISQAKRKRETERKRARMREKRKGRASVVTKTSATTKGSNGSVGSSSTSTRPPTATTTIPDRNSPPSSKPSPRVSSSSRLCSVETKRKRSESVSDNELPTVADLVRRSPTHKKRKVNSNGSAVLNQDRISYQTKRHGKVEEEQESDEDTDSNPPKAKPKDNRVKKQNSLADGRRANFPTTHQAPSSRKAIAMKTATRRDTKKVSSSVPTKSGTKRKKQVRAAADSSSSEEEREQKEPKVRAAAPTSKGKTNGVEMPEPPPIQRSPVLSPRAKIRLAQFDALVLDLLDQPIRQQSEEFPYNDFDNNGFDDDAEIVPMSNDTREVNDELPKIPILRTTSLKALGNKRKPNGGMPAPPKSPVGDNSYLIGVVPETEPESSSYNTQSQSQPAPNSHRQKEPFSLLLPPQTPPATPSRNSNASSPRSTLISRMKPKTPSSSNLSPSHPPLAEPLSPLRLKGSRLVNLNANSKPLRPLPVVSPLTFRLHLPSPDPPIAATSGSRIESVFEHEVQEYAPSPIENFSSPEKEGRVKKRKGKLIPSSMSTSTSSSSSLAETGLRERQTRSPSVEIIEIVESDSMSRGQALAERAQQQRLRERGMERAGLNGSFAELLQTQKDLGTVLEGQEVVEDIVGRSIRGLASREEGQGKGSEVEIGIGVAGDNGFDVTTMTEDASILQEMEDAYVDLNGEGGRQDSAVVVNGQGCAEHDVPAHIRYRQEEEESTQDVLDCIRGGVEEEGGLGKGDGGGDNDGNGDDSDSGPSIEITSADATMMEGEERAKMEGVVKAPAVPIESKEHNLDEQPESVQDNGEGRVTSGALDESGTRSKSKSPEGARNTEGEIVTVPTSERMPESNTELPSMPSKDVTSIANDETNRISTTEGGERTTGDSLVEKRNLRDALMPASIPDPIVAELQQQLTALRETLAANTIAWDAERITLTATIESQTRTKVSAEEDRDFFREQYAQASGYVTSVREENQALELRAQVAEKRAVEGVGLVRTMFSERVKTLEGEALQHKRTAELLMEVDRRTGEDIRRRAGEEPRLRARCAELGQRIEELEFEMEVLQMNLADLEREKENWLGETEVYTQLQVVEREEGEGEERSASAATAETQECPSDQMVHRCQWRTDGTEACNWFSSSIEELERHLYHAGHLQEA